ncbi:hypothetical protein FS837_011334 [Tulasnella sp. UAMH 9824]|nr:hypothetical protein FS837_011334 [Tulasnella sp. UAMH 9824]
MRPNTRSQHPSSNAPDPTPPPRRAPAGRKRKASNPPAEDPAPEAPAPPTARKAKKKKTGNGPSAPTEPAASPAVPSTQQVVAQAQPAAQFNDVPSVPSHPGNGERGQSAVVDPLRSLAPPTEPAPLSQSVPTLSEPIPPLSEPLAPLDDPFMAPDEPQADDIEPAGSNEAGPGEATRNRGQRAPTVREQNAALVKTVAELEAKIKQLSTDLRIIKKYKVMWVKEYSKKAKSGTAPPDSLIPRPPGEKGKNGWNLQDAMGLKDDDPLYNEILVKRQHPYLERFLGDWPAKEMVINALQNHRKALSAKAKAKVSTDPETQASFMAAAAEVDANAE